MRRIVIDTNCLLAILPSKSPYHQVWAEFVNGTIEFCVSTEILMEYEDQAEILVSNDKHFAILQDIDFPSVNVIRIQEFTNMLQSQ